MRITLAQIDSGTDVSRNLELIADYCARAANEGSELVVFPEYSTYEKSRVDRSFVDMAEPLDGPVAARLYATAARDGIAVVAGLLEASGGPEASGEPDRAFNTLVAIGPDGSRLASYRKIHLFDCQGFRESDYIKPAQEPVPVTFSCGGMTFGLMTCYDLRFPELARILADAGAEVLLVCSSWVPGTAKTEQWATLAKARAIENGVYVAAVSQTPPVSIGYSMLIDPLGTVLHGLGTEPAIATLDLSPDAVQAARDQFPTWRHHRLPW
ncbi:carbon-nitrogen hydrolase family protein [Arthrobacter bambusae]|uniref:carbon-nitrogen hydrolase family protein n=1 Tax=Arthrobacter bambusae TaxID=1338426 RepID=UPI00277E9CB8|nr:carbon-nitrogen hydrolase family protein [Arthrobacter bambusae]MDQ0213270.1 putative amidohydrolase [Arthrobacter bambusae]MDQ0235880.1 putative amidohydrolase [Arthrobacter bambusae]